MLNGLYKSISEYSSVPTGGDHTLLIKAAWEGKEDIIQLLLDKGADIEAKAGVT